MRVRHTRLIPRLVFDGVVAKPENIVLVFKNIRRVRAPFVVFDTQGVETRVTSILSIQDDRVVVLIECFKKYKLKKVFLYEDIVDVFVETTPKSDRIICQNEWRSIEV